MRGRSGVREQIGVWKQWSERREDAELLALKTKKGGHKPGGVGEP